MRFITGLIFGIILTIGTAYVADAMRTGSGPDGASERMVNWTVVSDNLGDLPTEVHHVWTRLVGGAKSIDRKVEKTGT